MNHLSNYKPQDLGYKLFFTKEDEQMVPMRWSRASRNKTELTSDPMANDIVNNGYIAGPMHFGESVEKIEGHKFFDIDLKQAYSTFLVNYARGKFNYKVGANRRYFTNTQYFTHMTKGLRMYRIAFAVKTEGREQSRLYKRWFLKTTKIKNLIMTDYEFGGEILLPDIDNLVNDFLNEVDGYEESTAEVIGMIVASGRSNVYINEKRLSEYMRIRNNPEHPLQSDAKLIINASTGYLAVMDKILYYTMVNQVRSELFKLMRAIDRWNLEREDLPIRYVAANTDGITMYAADEAHYALYDIIETELNPYSVFKFIIKDEYEFASAKFTPNDIRREQ